ncbi:MAG: endonuclease SmrB, partial [Pseudoalteromonas sp.]|nr:endonuclease SmrB [Pseudoalteromonas sp.]
MKKDPHANNHISPDDIDLFRQSISGAKAFKQDT